MKDYTPLFNSMGAYHNNIIYLFGGHRSETESLLKYIKTKTCYEFNVTTNRFENKKDILPRPEAFMEPIHFIY